MLLVVWYPIFLSAEIFSWIEGAKRFCFLLPIYIKYYYEYFFFLYFVSEGTLNFFELNTLEKSSSFHLLIHVNCQLNWNFYPLILESLADGTNRIDVKAVIRQTSIIRFFSFLLASSLYFSKKKKISNSTHRPSIDPLRLENSLLPVITGSIYIYIACQFFILLTRSLDILKVLGSQLDRSPRFLSHFFYSNESNNWHWPSFKSFLISRQIKGEEKRFQ